MHAEGCCTVNIYDAGFLTCVDLWLDRGAEIFTALLVIWFRETNFVISEKKDHKEWKSSFKELGKKEARQEILQQSLIIIIFHMFLP